MMKLLVRMILIAFIAVGAFAAGSALSPIGTDVQAKAPCNEDLCMGFEGDPHRFCSAPLPNDPIPENKNCDGYWETVNGVLVHKCRYQECGTASQ